MHKLVLGMLVALLTPPAAFAIEHGQVVWVDPGCNHFIAQIGQEFGTFNWRAGNAPNLGDELEGELLLVDAGSREIQNLTKGGSNTVYILALGPRLYPMIHTAPVQCKERFRGSVK